MNILRLPPPLRRLIWTHQSLILSLQRHVSTAAAPISFQDDPPTPSPRLTLTSSNLNSYTLTPPPTASELRAARTHFTRRLPTLLYSSTTFRDLPATPYPEVAFLGRSNVGKSSLLNALFNRTRRAGAPAHVSKRAGRTRTMNGFGVGGGGGGGRRASSSIDVSSIPVSDAADAPAARAPPRLAPHLTALGPGALVVVDMPGYGAGSRAEWGAEALKVLRARTQLRRTFVLVDAEHGLKASDGTLLAHLRREGVAAQVVLSKVDKILLPGARVPSPAELARRLERLREVVARLRDGVGAATGGDTHAAAWLGDVLCCSAEKSIELQGGRGKVKLGIDELRWAVLTACGLEGL